MKKMCHASNCAQKLSHSMSNELTSSDVSRVIFIAVYQHEHPNPGAQKMKYTLYYKKNNQKRNHC